MSALLICRLHSTCCGEHNYISCLNTQGIRRYSFKISTMHFSVRLLICAICLCCVADGYHCLHCKLDKPYPWLCTEQ